MTDLIEERSRSKRLKDMTHETHDRLDKAIVAQRPFENLERYARFLAVQYGFHRDIDALYDDPALDALLPDLSGRRRFSQIVQDLKDVGGEAPLIVTSPRFTHGEIDLPTAMGWLYVAEGSHLGAAFLLKWSAALGLNETHGARHLAASPEGRARHWREFTAALDSIDLTPVEEARVIEGGKAAFVRVHGLVRDVFGDV
ncbi:biliverdin-producing heme oxygenase [Brevundimonas sp. SL130]|uniref:biliverdin-producing heme oxygenase n=1 Tax=Brevundimonas sp. SL130 TaxID=2995143 RepID=UPI00226CD200|nr:biliverdin-producing heme oxygenase [Brevundimonas sp. SL130]WAC58317.1 biliverdin-producing heme oxygenase [Brevundimonas sp. SL130]